MYSGFDERGEWFQLYQIGFGGIPGRPVGDGPDGHSLWPAFTNVPNEFLESYFPLRIVKYETIADSGGAGQHRGGNGLSMGYMFLEPGQISIHDDRWLTYPWGVNGGQPGGRSSKIMVRANGTKEILPSKCDRVRVEAGDVLFFNTWGGGGWGDPLKRAPEQVAKDAMRGLVSIEGAKRYGVVLRGDHSVDAPATAALREKIARERGATLPLFNFGGTVDELKARCRAETGLEPPKTPVFPRWMSAPRRLAAE